MIEHDFDAALVQEALSDLCPGDGNRRYLSVLAAAARAGIPSQIATAGPPERGPRAAAWARAVVEEEGVDRELAKWAIDAWIRSFDEGFEGASHLVESRQDPPLGKTVPGGMLSRLGHYVLLEELGRSAMTVVWRAYDPVFEREIAIKELLFLPSAGDALRAEQSEKFVGQGRAVAKLNHPGIVKVHEADVFSGRPAIVMELVQGETLGDVLRTGPLPPSDVQMVLGQVLDAVAYAHESGVAHGGIKPDSVFLTREGQTKLTDFGIAQIGATAGSLGHNAPAQIEGAPTDQRTDIFSIGLLGYEMLSGQDAVAASGDRAPTTSMDRPMHEDSLEGTSGALSSVLAMALEEDPERRFQSAHAFATALQTCASPTPSRTRKTTKSSTAWTHYLTYAAIAATVLTLAVLAVWLKTAGGRAGAEASSKADIKTALTATPTPPAPSTGAIPAPPPRAMHELKPDRGKKPRATSTVKERTAIYEGRETTVKHGADLLVDRTKDDLPNTTTAWQARGSGKGESVTVYLTGPSVVGRIRIIPGYHKWGNAGLWYRYDTTPSVKALTISLDDGTSCKKELADLRGTDPDNNHILSISMPSDMLKPTTSVKLTINDIYPPKDHPPAGKTDEKQSQDTAISALVFWGWDPSEAPK